MHNCFKLKTKICFCDDNQMLVINVHASYISTEFLQITRKDKIVYLYLLAYSIDLLQTFYIDVFDFLKQNYKTLLSEKIRCITYNTNKADFIFFIQKTQLQFIHS